MEKVHKIVLTGGPCAGKTSCLNAIREQFGDCVVTAPEAATLVLGGGFPPPGHQRIECAEDEWVQAFQGAILSIQLAVESAFEQLARRCRVRLIVCDRGVLDGAAYWPGGRDAFLRHFGCTLEDYFARYQSVLHLQSLVQSHPHLYGAAGNALRYENVREASHAEDDVRAAWQGHPGLIVIPAKGELQDKITCVIEQIRELLAMS